MERARLSVEWLTQARIDRNWTQEHVAECMDVEIKTIRRWEQGLHQPHIRQYYRLCKLFQKALPNGFQPAAVAAEGEDVQERASEERQLPLVDEAEDACTRFQATDLTVRLLRILWTWPFRDENARYHELQSLIMQEVKQRDNTTMQENPINRRNALRRIAVLPIEVYGLSLVSLTSLHAPEELLAQCAAGITSCQYLRKGKDIAFVSSTISRYIPTLRGIVDMGKKAHRKSAAEMLAQCLILKAGCVIQDRNYMEAVRFAKQAENYAHFAGHFEMSIAAINAQANAFDYADQWEQGMYTARRGQLLLQEHAKGGSLVSPFLQSALAVRLANCQAQMGKKYEHEALTLLGEAQAAFYSEPDATAPDWIEHTEAGLIAIGGLIHYHLDMQEEAIASFTLIDALPYSEIGYAEALLDRVKAELERADKPRDMEFCIQHWEQGIQKAIMIRSEQTFASAQVVYRHMRTAWPGEPRIHNLRDQIEHW